MRWSVCLLALTLLGCDEEPKLITVPPRVCLREYTPASYDVYFVIDVSTSMGPFLSDVREELVEFASRLPQFNDDGQAVEVQFFVVAFVNDIRRYPMNVRRLRDATQVQEAFDEAIAKGADNLNLNGPTYNAESDENLLDALAEVIADGPTAEANLVMLATDAGFAEAPDRLSGGIEVRSTYADVIGGLSGFEARVHAFTQEQDGLTRGYHGMPALTSLPGSTHHDIAELTGARDQIRETLTLIAETADCN